MVRLRQCCCLYPDRGGLLKLAPTPGALASSCWLTRSQFPRLINGRPRRPASCNPGPAPTGLRGHGLFHGRAHSDHCRRRQGQGGVESDPRRILVRVSPQKKPKKVVSPFLLPNYTGLLAWWPTLALAPVTVSVLHGGLSPTPRLEGLCPPFNHKPTSSGSFACLSDLDLPSPCMHMCASIGVFWLYCRRPSVSTAMVVGKMLTLGATTSR